MLRFLSGANVINEAFEFDHLLKILMLLKCYLIN